MYIIFLGAPGAGKGTQASEVAGEMNLVHVATGDLFRAMQSQETELAVKVKSFMGKGLLVPDDLTIQMVLERIAQPDCAGGVIFDGFPRTLKQAEALDEALAGQGKSIDKVIYIKVAEEELVQRLSGRWICRQCQAPYHEVSSPPAVTGKCDKCGGELYQRADDTVDTIKKRLNVYSEETAPLIGYYTEAGKLLEVDGSGDVGGVKQRIVEFLGRAVV